jgi:hypothetical protein
MEFRMPRSDHPGGRSGGCGDVLEPRGESLKRKYSAGPSCKVDRSDHWEFRFADGRALPLGADPRGKYGVRWPL